MPVAKVATYILKRYGSFPHFSCNMHNDWSFKFASKTVVNIFFNNKQKKSKDSVRRETVTGIKVNTRIKIFDMPLLCTKTKFSSSFLLLFGY